MVTVYPSFRWHSEGKICICLLSVFYSTTFSTYDRHKMINLSKWECAVRNTGVKFEVKFSREKNGIDQTELSGAQRKLVMQRIDFDSFLIQDPNLADIKFVWNELLDIEAFMHQDLNAQEVDQLEIRCKTWCDAICNRSFLSSDATPYCHIIAFHACECIRLHGRLSEWSQEGYEKMNDLLTKRFQRATNHRFDSAFTQLLEKNNRIALLSIQNVRQRRDYACSVCKSDEHRLPNCPLRK